jgi:hypothetical protein
MSVRSLCETYGSDWHECIHYVMPLSSGKKTLQAVAARSFAALEGTNQTMAADPRRHLVRIRVVSHIVRPFLQHIFDRIT